MAAPGVRHETNPRVERFITLLLKRAEHEYAKAVLKCLTAGEPSWPPVPAGVTQKAANAIKENVQHMSRVQ